MEPHADVVKGGYLKADGGRGVQVLLHVAQKLDRLHKAGWVHRDLTPSNIIWLPSKNEWSLIDFAFSAQTGHKCELAFSLYYVPPEVMVVYWSSGKKHIKADPAEDMWALGVRAR
jgi:serine/threonine protein kinase